MILAKLLTAFHVFFYRLTNGGLGAQFRGFDVLLLTTMGRKTGIKHTVPLAYIKDDDAYVVIGSNGGSEQHPGWYYNLMNNSKVEIQIKDQQITAHAEPAAGERRNQLWKEFVAEAPEFAEYERKTKRELPIIVLRQIETSPEPAA